MRENGEKRPWCAKREKCKKVVHIKIRLTSVTVLTYNKETTTNECYQGAQKHICSESHHRRGVAVVWTIDTSAASLAGHRCTIRTTSSNSNIIGSG